MGLLFLIVMMAGAFVAVVLGQAALNRRIVGSEQAGGWFGPVARALLPGQAYEVGAPWRALALVCGALLPRAGVPRPPRGRIRGCHELGRPPPAPQIGPHGRDPLRRALCGPLAFGSGPSGARR